ncbi:kinase-like domain-containing protein [Phakopsora pachyrhizi]|uniref:Kinase-like domain-containing protein n=1 Tax=Phakopsora pachyrhizi TaxID=170000 RepID=A0AAV0AG76_PHAPC|nr:kinase-like domain-containing protein [Phakopsora pachyrhizi]
MSNRSTAPSASPLLVQFPNTPLPNVGTRNYTVLKEVGDGSFGTVCLADWHSPLTLPPGKKLVAIKRMKKPFEGGWDECMKLKELKSLRSIPMHPFIIPLYDAFLHPTSRELYFVFECMEGNLYQLTKSRKGRPLAGGLVACIFEQILLGLNHVHSSGYFHRDMKPENLLITTTGLTDYPHGSPFALPTAAPERDVAVVVKIADFGLARETSSRPPYTEYVSTRWYRAPEVLLRAREYSNPVDMWALGAIMVETVTLKPLFPGTSEMDQVEKIMAILGDPKHNYGFDDKGRLRGGGQWLSGVALAEAVGFKFPDKPPIDFVQIFDISNVPIQLVDCLHELLRYEPSARLTTSQCLSHSYFTEIASRLIPPSLSGAALINHAAAIASGMSSPRSNGTYSAPSQYLNSQSQSMALDLPSISPQIVPSSHSQFPNARPTHVLTPSNSTGADSRLSDPEHHRHLSPHIHSHHSHYQQISSGSAPYNSHPEIQRRGSQPHECHHQPGYDYSAPVVSREPSYLSLASPSVPDASRNPAASSKSRGRTLASVFSGSQSLKRTPSDRAPTEVLSLNASSAALIIDPKKAKKEAEKAAKEEAKLELQAKREAARRSAQERSRAVLQKQRLAQGPDILIHVNPEFGAPVGAPRKTADKGKARATLHPPLPQIVEDVSRSRLGQTGHSLGGSGGGGGGGASGGGGMGITGNVGSDMETVGVGRIEKPVIQDRTIYDHSVNPNGRSYRDEGRRSSFNSSNTMDSDPGPGSHPQARPPERSPSLGSGYSRLSVASSPNLTSLYRASTPASTASSLEHQLVANMAGLSANEQDSHYHHHSHHPHHHHHQHPHHRHRPAQSNGSSRVTSEEAGLRRSRSPSDPRFSPYAVPGPRPSLPSISNFKFSQHGPPPQPALISPGISPGAKTTGWINEPSMKDEFDKATAAAAMHRADELSTLQEFQKGS